MNTPVYRINFIMKDMFVAPAQGNPITKKIGRNGEPLLLFTCLDHQRKPRNPYKTCSVAKWNCRCHGGLALILGDIIRPDMHLLLEGECHFVRNIRWPFLLVRKFTVLPDEKLPAQHYYTSTHKGSGNNEKPAYNNETTKQKPVENI